MKKFILSIVMTMMGTLTFSQIIENSPFDAKINHKHLYAKSPFEIVQQNALTSNYDVKFYWLNVALERTSTTISGNVTINAVVQNNPLDTFAVDLVSNLNVDSAKINGILQPVVHVGDKVYVKLSSPLSVASDFSVQIFYHGTPPSGGFFSGISHATSPSWGNEVVWTLSEPFNAYQWWPCKQDLTDKADSSWMFVTTSNQNKVGSNGLLSNVVTVPGNKLRYEWKSGYPIDYYLISVAVAKYVDYTIYCHPAGLTDSVMIQNYIYDNPSTLPYFKSIIDSTAQMIELYSQLFGMYPFKDEKYGHSMAPLGGGMEHQTMTTLGSFSFGLVCHELGHMWWGDHVTCSSWSDIWINEGFASYSEYLCRQYLHSWADAQAYLLDEHNSIMSEPDGSVYVPPSETNDVNRIFDSRLSYDKGSAIIHMIRFELQDDTTFFNVLKGFQTQYSHNVASGADFKNYLNTHTSIDFTDFFNQWYTGEGYPTYSIVWYQANDTVYFSTTQTTSSAITPLFKMLMEYKLKSASGDTLVLEYQTSNVNNFKVHTTKAISGIDIDPNNWVINKVGSIIVGAADINSSVNFFVSPVPCKDKLDVYFSQNPGKNTLIQIQDITGRKIYESLAGNDKVVIDTQSIPAGIYLVKVTDGINSMVKKFLKE